MNRPPLPRRRAARAAALPLAIALCALCVQAPAAAGEPADEDPWTELRDLIGVWRGDAAGFGGTADLAHEWDLAVQDKFLRLRSRSVQRSEDGSGEVHEDVGYLSRDSDHGAYVFRQFLSEGFVNTFDVTREGEVITFEARESESAGGVRARMILTFDGENDYGMVLELAMPGGDFSGCQEMDLHRVKGGNE
jgi:hypothetical protein